MPETQRPRILLTGAGGIVGRAVHARSLAAGYEVVAIVSPSSQYRHPDVRVADLARTLPQMRTFTHFVHLAAALPHDSRYADDRVAGEMTSRIDDVVLSAAEQQRARILYASTCSLYNPRDPSTKTEASRDLRLDTAYRSAKFAAEQRVLTGRENVAFRISAPYGLGLFSKTVLARFVQAARSGGKVEVWGTGSREQNFIASDDIATFLVSAIENDASGLFNVAGETVTMRDLAKKVVKVVGAGEVEDVDKDDPLDGEVARFSIERAVEDLSWRPKIGLCEGIRQISGVEFRS